MPRRCRGTCVVAVVVVIGTALTGAGSALASGYPVKPPAHHHRRKRPKPKPPHAVDPLTRRATAAWIRSRAGNVSVGVDDLSTGQEWFWNPYARDWSASIIKADILETRLHQTLARHEPLRAAETATAVGMIEASDNDDATELWDEDDGPLGISAYNAAAGLRQTTPSYAWGETITSVSDQLLLLRQLALPSKLLTPAAQAYQLDLMEHIDPGEGWGVSGGVPGGVTVALKNGWVPLGSSGSWEINSIGWVRGDGRDYLIAALTAWNPSEAYGIETIDRISALVYGALPAPRRAGKPGGGGHKQKR